MNKWRVVHTPIHDGDGYSYGGDALLITPNGTAINCGARGTEIAKFIAKLANTATENTNDDP